MDSNRMNYSVQRAAAGEENIGTGLLIMCLLEGEMTLQYQGERYRMKREDVLLINPGVSYTIRDVNHAVYGEASFSIRMITEVLQSNRKFFYCNSVVDNSHSYQDLRDIFFQLTVEYISRTHQSRCYMDSLLLKLLDCLVEHYQPDQKAMEIYETENDARMREIMQYIITNLDQEISLNELAEKMFVSASTLSRIFKKNTGEYFADYVMQLRVKNAVSLLEHSGQNMLQIAVACGFANSASFNRAFRKIMGVTPTEYREAYQSSREQEEKISAPEPDICKELRQKGYEFGKKEREEMLRLDLKNNQGRKYQKPWNLMINIGPIWDLNQANVQFHTLYLNEQLHFQYIRLWNVFSRKMMINNGKTIGQYNYDAVNQVLDFLVQHRLKPFLDLGRRPDTALRSFRNEVFFEEQYIPFESRENWECMIEDFFSHIVSRYGQEEVSGWVFELSRDCIHGDSLPQYRLYQEEQYDFFDAWRYLWQTVKKKIPAARFGGVTGIVVKDWKFLLDFYKRCNTENVRPDYVSFLMFPYDVRSNQETQTTRILSQDKEYEENQIREIRKLLKQTGMEETPLYITEWNNTISNRNYLNDSCYRAAYIVKKAAAISEQVDMLGIMGGTDWVSSHMDTVGIVNGGIGLLTKDTIRKPAYFAVDFLNQLGDYLLAKGENYIATRKENGDIYILCYYYSWFKRSYFLEEEDVDLRKYHSLVFEEEEPLHLNIRLENLKESGEYYLKKRTLNRRHGSILNEWEEFQYDVRLTRQDVKYLQGISFPTLSQSRKVVTKGNHTLDMKVTMEPHEISLIHIFCRT